jgi:hypothetical protein
MRGFADGRPGGRRYSNQRACGRVAWQIMSAASAGKGDLTGLDRIRIGEVI